MIDPTFLAVTPAVSTPQRWNLTTPANASDLAIQATEEVTISAYSGTSATTPKVTMTRAAGAKISATPYSDTNLTPTTVWNGGTSLAGATLVQVDVTYRWRSVLGGRLRSETSSMIVAAGTKK